MTWKNYKYRFVPWILSNFESKSTRVLKHEEKRISDNEAMRQIEDVCKFLEKFLDSNIHKKWIPEDLYTKIRTQFIENYGFCIEKRMSKLTDGGLGVLVTHGNVPTDTVVGLYPGTIYKIGEPIFLQSIANSFVFRCADGTLIDGNDKGVSKMIYKSCTYRDRIGPHLTSDLSWLSSYPFNLLNIGQYVNNHTEEFSSNVMYQEIDLPLKIFSYKLRKFIPNVRYSSIENSENISCGEEMYSSYFTTIE